MMQLDSVQIGVDDVDRATLDYTLVLGVDPVVTANGSRRFQFTRGAIELEAGAPGVRALRFAPADSAAVTWPADRESFNGLDVRTGVARASASVAAPDCVHAIDHVVINTPDVDRAIATWRDRLGIRLALDREFPKRGLRMCFFRSAGITLEFVGSLGPPADRSGSDRLFGLAYQVADLARCRARLLQAEADISEIRAGNKPGTSVATVRSHTAGVPTLLITATGK